MRLRKIGGYLLLVTLLIPGIVNAGEKVEVKNETELRECFKVNDNTCVLTDNITLTTKLQLEVPSGNKITLDLNGKTITENNLGLTKGLIAAGNGSELIVNDSSNGKGAITATNSWAALQVHANSKLTINGGNFTGYWYALSGNGKEHDTTITINDGTFNVIETAEAPAVYHPQRGTFTINGGTFTGTLGMEIRAGKLIMNGGTIVATKAPASSHPNGSGTTTEGAGIAIAQHTTKMDTSVIINGGTIKGYSAIYQSNPQNNDPENSGKVSIEIKGGTFEATNGGTQVVYSEDLKNYIIGGTFSIKPNIEYVNTNYNLIEKDGKFVVEPNKTMNATDESGNTIVEFESEEAFSTEYILNIESKDLTNEDDVIYLVEDHVFNESQNTKVTDTKVLATYDITVTDGTSIIPMENGKFTISVKIDATSADKYNTFKAAYINDEGKVEEVLNASRNEDYVTFETTHLSTYSILGYNATTTSVENPQTGDGIMMYAFIAIISMIGLAGTTLYLKRKFN